MPGGVELDGGEYERLAGHADEGREEDRGLGGGELEGEVQDRRGISRNQNVSDDLEEGHEGMDERELGRGAGRENREVVDGGTAVHGRNKTMDNGERAGGALAAGNEGSEGSGEVLVTLTSRSRDLLDMMCSSAMRGFIARKDRAMARAGILDALLRDAEAEAGKLPVSSKNHAEDHQLVRIKIGSKGRGGKHDGKNLVNRLARLHKKVPLGNSLHAGAAINTLVAGSLLRQEVAPRSHPNAETQQPESSGYAQGHLHGNIFNDAQQQNTQHQGRAWRTPAEDIERGNLHGDLSNVQHQNTLHQGCVWRGPEEEVPIGRAFAEVLNPLVHFDTSQLVAELARRRETKDSARASSTGAGAMPHSRPDMRDQGTRNTRKGGWQRANIGFEEEQHVGELEACHVGSLHERHVGEEAGNVGSMLNEHMGGWSREHMGEGRLENVEGGHEAEIGEWQRGHMGQGHSESVGGGHEGEVGGWRRGQEGPRHVGEQVVLGHDDIAHEQVYGDGGAIKRRRQEGRQSPSMLQTHAVHEEYDALDQEHASDHASALGQGSATTSEFVNHHSRLEQGLGNDHMSALGQGPNSHQDLLMHHGSFHQGNASDHISALGHGPPTHQNVAIHHDSLNQGHSDCHTSALGQGPPSNFEMGLHDHDSLDHGHGSHQSSALGRRTIENQDLSMHHDHGSLDQEHASDHASALGHGSSSTQDLTAYHDSLDNDAGHIDDGFARHQPPSDEQEPSISHHHHQPHSQRSHSPDQSSAMDQEHDSDLDNEEADSEVLLESQ